MSQERIITGDDRVQPDDDWIRQLGAAPLPLGAQSNNGQVNSGQADTKGAMSAGDPPELPQDEAQHSVTGDGASYGASEAVAMDPGRRVARRRPAGPSRDRTAANDDGPSIGGLIYALEQKPSNRPFYYAGVFSALWGGLGLTIAALTLWTEIAKGTTVAVVLLSPVFFLTLAAIGLPVGVIWFLALLAWRAEELRMRSSTMTEVAVRLAEPDRMAEQSIASLGQNVRRQVSFMNDAVSRALGRAGELEALVHSEVAALERSYEENEKRIRGLISELSGERHALLNTSERVAITLRTLGSEVPALIDKLSDQQIKLSTIIAGAGENLTALESAMSTSAVQLETTIGSRTQHLQHVLENSASKIDVSLTAGAEGLERHLTERAEQMQAVLEGYTAALASALSDRTENLQTVFEEYTRALDTTLANRAQALDVQLVERTASLDAAFSQRLQLFDDSIQRSTQAIDGAVNERATALTTALDRHATTFRETVTRQASELDDSLMQGINAVRRSSENITRQSLKAIEGLAGQSDLLKNVSENLLGQINSVTNRFENQGQQIMKAANVLETVNYKIDTTLKTRHADLTRTLDQISGTTDQFDRAITNYSSTIEGTMGEAERRARIAAEELQMGAEARSRAVMSEIEHLRNHTASESERALEDMRNRFTYATGEVQQQLGSMAERVDLAALDARTRAAQAAAELADEQARIKAQMDRMPQAARESADAMRRSLHDQLAALDKLNQLTSRAALTRDVSPPMPPVGGPYVGAQPLTTLAATYASEPRSSDAQPALSSLSTAIQNEASAVRLRPLPGAADNQSGWNFGDLLARASKEEDALQAAAAAQGPGGGAGAAGAFSLNVGVIARALDPTTAEGLWSRLRTGQRGVMVRSIYSPEGRVAFDEISRRAKTDPDLQATIGRYLADFERILKDAEVRDPSGRMLQSHLVSDTGRVYLFLAHASGRLP